MERMTYDSSSIIMEPLAAIKDHSKDLDNNGKTYTKLLSTITVDDAGHTVPMLQSVIDYPPFANLLPCITLKTSSARLLLIGTLTRK